MADALDSGSSGGNTVRVQVPFSASFISSGSLVNTRVLLLFSLFFLPSKVITVITIFPQNK